MVYASSRQLKCFECGDVGHKQVACPRKRLEEVDVSPVSPDFGAAGATVLGPAVVEDDARISAVSATAPNTVPSTAADFEPKAGSVEAVQNLVA